LTLPVSTVTSAASSVSRSKDAIERAQIIFMAMSPEQAKSTANYLGVEWSVASFGSCPALRQPLSSLARQLAPQLAFANR